MDSQKPAPIQRLPFLRNFEDAEAFFKQEHDPFYLGAFLIQCWLGGLLTRAAGQYAENKNPKDRSLQTGESWRSLGELFDLQPEKPCQYLLSCLFRFSASDDSPTNSLRHALVPLTIEHRLTGDYFGPQTQLKTQNSKPATTDFLSPQTQLKTNNSKLKIDFLCRRTIIRWCDWLDAEIHLRTHRRWHEAPACFDPDPETRHLAALGNAQRHLAKLDGRAKACWLVDFANAAEHYRNSPKWTALGKAMADKTDRPWLYPDVDTLVISLWPLVKAYNWTFRDLLNVIRPGLSRRRSTPHSALPTPHFCPSHPPTPHSALPTPHFCPSPSPIPHSALCTPHFCPSPSPIPHSALCTPHFCPSHPPTPHSAFRTPHFCYPVAREQDFATYCVNILGLRKTAKGLTTRNGRPPGSDIARQFCPALAVNM